MLQDPAETIGVMFAPIGDRFPTLAELASNCRGHYLYALEPRELELFGAWSAVAWDPRTMIYGDEDHEAIDETNFAAILAAVDEPCDDRASEEDALAAGVVLWSRGNTRVLAVDLRAGREWAWSDDLERELLNLARSLADYPLLNEDAYNQREWEAWEEYAPTAWSDELRELGHVDSDRRELLERIDAGAALACLSSQLDYWHGFSGEYGPNFLEIAANLENPAWVAEHAPHADADAARWRELVAAAEREELAELELESHATHDAPAYMHPRCALCNPVTWDRVAAPMDALALEL